jgi:hypothetical protein
MTGSLFSLVKDCLDFSSWPYLGFSVHHQLENVSFVVAISFR